MLWTLTGCIMPTCFTVPRRVGKTTPSRYSGPKCLNCENRASVSEPCGVLLGVPGDLMKAGFVDLIEKWNAASRNQGGRHPRHPRQRFNTLLKRPLQGPT